MYTYKKDLTTQISGRGISASQLLKAQPALDHERNDPAMMPTVLHPETRRPRNDQLLCVVTGDKVLADGVADVGHSSTSR